MKDSVQKNWHFFHSSNNLILKISPTLQINISFGTLLNNIITILIINASKKLILANFKLLKQHTDKQGDKEFQIQLLEWLTFELKSFFGGV